MLESLSAKLFPPSNLMVSRRASLLLALLAGISLSVLAAGFFLSRRRRRYRAISATSLDATSKRNSSGHAALSRSSTFRDVSEDSRQRYFLRTSGRDMTDNGTAQLKRDGAALDNLDQAEEHERAGQSEEYERASVSSSGSFHSTVESMEHELSGDNGLFLSAMELAKRGGITCRNIRTQMLNCQSDIDFLAKVHCVRLAFDDIISSTHNRHYFKVTARQIVSSFLSSTDQDPRKFCDAFDELTDYIEGEEGWRVAVEELTARKVVSMNVYDIALDFILLDAFDDIEHPPSAIVTVLSNTWITAGMKQSMISAAIWSLLKAKTRMLTHRDGFMSRFYVMSERLSPTLAWGFLGTDKKLKDKCTHFKVMSMNFIRSIFSLESVNYSTVHTLADDILTLAKQTADQMRTNTDNNSVDFCDDKLF